MDLSAAFDVLRPSIALNIMKEYEVSEPLIGCLEDFLTNREIYVEYKDVPSKQMKMDIGCVQGSILGPRLFTLYLGRLSQILEHQDIVTYADDSYVVVGAKTIQELKAKLEELSKRHVSYLKKMGMIVNTSKTEVVVFRKKGHIEIETFKVDDTEVLSTTTMKVLGLTFQTDMKWNFHVNTVLKKIQSKLSMLRKIRRNLDLQDYLKVATAQLYSILYYGSPVWMNDTLEKSLWQKLKSLHYRILRVGIRDFKRRKSKKHIDKTCKRATPEMWSKYASGALVIKIIRDRSPLNLYIGIMANFYTEPRKPNHGKFFDNSQGKIGKHRLENRLEFMTELGPWLDDPNIGNDALRRMLKDKLDFNFDRHL